MNKTLIIGSIVTSLLSAPVWAAPVTKTFILKSKAFNGKVTRLLPGAFDSMNPGSLIPTVDLSDITGRQTLNISSDDLMVDKVNNHLVLVVNMYVDPVADGTSTTYTNLEWVVEERTAADECADRDANMTPGPCGIVRGEGRVFTAKSVSSLANSLWSGVTTVSEADGSRSGPFPLGDHEATSQVNVKFDKNGDIKSVSFPGSVVGWADILANPEDDEDNLTFKLKIKTVK